MKRIALLAAFLSVSASSAFAGPFTNGIAMNGIAMNGVSLNGINLSTRRPTTRNGMLISANGTVN